MKEVSVYKVVHDDPRIMSVLGSPVRVYAFDEAPQDVDGQPYCTWYYISGDHDQDLGGNTGDEAARIQFDVYSVNARSARVAAQTMEQVMAEAGGVTVSYSPRSLSYDGRRYRYGWDMEFLL